MIKRNLVEIKGWETLNGRLKALFQDDSGPLNEARRKVADVFYLSELIKFKVRFGD